MKLVTAIIKPYKLDDVKEALSKIGIKGATVSDVKGFGRQKGYKEFYRGSEMLVEFIPKIKLEVAVQTKDLDNVINTIIEAAKTDSIGCGKIFVTNLESVIRIRTGEKDEEAI